MQNSITHHSRKDFHCLNLQVCKLNIDLNFLFIFFFKFSHNNLSTLTIGVWKSINFVPNKCILQQNRKPFQNDQIETFATGFTSRNRYILVTYNQMDFHTNLHTTEQLRRKYCSIFTSFEITHMSTRLYGLIGNK